LTDWVPISLIAEVFWGRLGLLDFAEALP
jgi:hypothetical protein